MGDGRTLTANWNYPTPVRFGVGRIRELPAACRELGIHRPLIVTDRGLLKLPLVEEVKAVLAEAGLNATVFGEVRGNPVGGDVEAGVRAFHAEGCDGVVALGGGSALDVGKAVALMVGQSRPLWDFEDVGDNYLRVNVDGMVPCVAVPTTSGTGSEVGRSSVIVDEASHRKLIIFHARMLPGRVIADPALSAGLPAELTAWTGIDALSHNLEAYCSPYFHPQADGIAVEGIRLVFEALEAAVRDGQDLDARAKMMAASLMGATAFQKGLGAMHSLAHPIGGKLDTHHGLTNAVVMPYVLMFNRAAIEPRIERLASYLGFAGGFTGFFERVLALREAVRIPPTLAALGVGEQHVAMLAPLVPIDPTAGTNPVTLTEENSAELLRRCIRGDLSAW